MIEITATGGLATVQDLGRLGGLSYGVGMAGAMDPLALAAANLLLGNAEDAAGIEIPIFPFAVRFTGDCAFALTGADCAAMLDGAPIPPWWCAQARAGQVLTLGLPQGRLPRACRAYLCVGGGLDVPVVLGSRSTQLRGAFGGVEGRALRTGDVLRAADPGAGVAGFGLVPPSFATAPDADGVTSVRVLPAAEYPCFTEAARAALWNGTWKITAQSDRYGYRLAGETLSLSRPLEMQSHGIVPGVIQVPPGGQPIIQMRDAQPSGGYPKIGAVIEADLWLLGQAAPGSLLRFVETSWEAALDARDANRGWLDEAGRIVGLYRQMAGRG
jgi:biotin-dependent carboxylase-like uncharacterized protein